MANSSHQPSRPHLSIQSMLLNGQSSPYAHPDSPNPASSTTLRRVPGDAVSETSPRYTTRPETSSGYGLPEGFASDSAAGHRQSVSSTTAPRSAALHSPVHPQQPGQGSPYQHHHQLSQPQQQQQQQQQSWQYSHQQQQHYSYQPHQYQQYWHQPHQTYQGQQNYQNHQMPSYQPPHYQYHQYPQYQQQQQHAPPQAPLQPPQQPPPQPPQQQSPLRSPQQPKCQTPQRQQQQQQKDEQLSPHMAPLRSPVFRSTHAPPRTYFSPPASGPRQNQRDRSHSPSPAPPSSAVEAIFADENGSRDPSEPGYRAASTHSADYSCPSPTTAGSDILTPTPPVEPKKSGAAAPVTKRPPMRSSIACVRCRRSKIKCVNNGEGKAACETCLKTKRDCHYPAAGTSSLPDKDEPELLFISVSASGSGKLPANSLKRDESGQPAERAAADRKRLKKTEDSFRLDAQRSGAYYANEVLSAPYLTEAMWTEIFDIYRLNFATELPFLHMPTLKEKMGNKFKASVKRRSDSTNLVLLGVLTLTSRFHSDLVKYISYSLATQNGIRIRGGYVKPDPFGASEYYANVLTRALGPLQPSMTTVSVERVQAFLMLGLYEWSQSNKKTNGIGAWMYVGVAIRMAQALGLCSEEQPNRLCRPPSAGDIIDVDANAEDVVRQEIRRRTMFSCFILDRLLACGKGRMPAIRSEDLHVQLPCSEFSFDLSEKVQTGFLKPVQQVLQAAALAGMGGGNTTTTTTSETESISVSSTIMRPSHDSVLSRFITLVDIWGEISQYSFSGGRLMEKRPPWEDSSFRRLRNVLDDFYASLPSTFRLSSSNYHKHENHQASGAYVSLHMLGAVCQIMLHREYVPFIPIRCRRPMGPLDEPIFPEGSAPEGFWDESAEQMFKAARDIVMLTEICTGRRKMPISSLTVFSVWTAAFVGIYAWHFPQLDTHKHMVWSKGSERRTTTAADGGGEEGGSGNGDDAFEAANAANAARSTGAVDLTDVDGADGDSAGADAEAGAAGREMGAGTGADQSNEERAYDITRNGPTGTTYSVLRIMSRSLHMASVYAKNFRDMDKYYEGVKKDFQEHLKRHGGKLAAKGGVRQGGRGGGLDEWRVHGVKITNNGTIVPSEGMGTTENSDVSRASTEVEESGSGTSTSASADVPEPAPEPAPEPVLAPTPGPDLGQATDSQGTRGNRQPTARTSASKRGRGARGKGGRGGRGRGRAPFTRSKPINEGEVIIVEDDADSIEVALETDVATQRVPDTTPLAPVAGSANTAVPTPVPSPPPWNIDEGTSAPPLHRPQASEFVDMDVLEVSYDVEQYVDNNQGKRWQEASQAIGIEQFSSGDTHMADGDEMWVPPTTSMYQPPTGAFTEILEC